MVYIIIYFLKWYTLLKVVKEIEKSESVHPYSSNIRIFMYIRCNILYCIQLYKKRFPGIIRFELMSHQLVETLEKWLIKTKSSCSNHFENISTFWALFLQNRMKIVHSIREMYLFFFATSKCLLRYWHLLCSRQKLSSNLVSTIMDIWRNWCAYLLLQHKFIERLRPWNWLRIAKNLLERVSQWS